MAMYTDVSQIAATLPRHAGPTNLYINFDGGMVPIDPVNNPGGASYTIRSFETESGDASLDRERDIQDILFQVAEVYAPFDVQVHRIYGAGRYGTGPGDTTVFVGGNLKNETTSGSGLFRTTTKYSYSETDGPSADYPRPGHNINSDPYDVAFVDPVVGSLGLLVLRPGLSTERGADSSHANIFDIKRSIAHEAGHTFGLSHIRADGLTDPTPLAPGTVNDVMSYDSPNQFFANQSLTLTAANNNGTSTTFTGTKPYYLDYTTAFGPNVGVATYFKTQNSYLTLDFALGVRPTDQYANVADGTAVDNGTYFGLGRIGIGPGAAPKVDLSSKLIQYGTLGRLGDDQVFTITPKTSGFFATNVSVNPTVGGLRPELLVYDSTGKTLLNYADPAANGTASLTLANGSTYQIVVASQDGNSTGSYYIGISSVFHFPIFPGPATTAAQTSGADALVPLVTPTPEAGPVAPPTPAANRLKLAFA
jgi:hypothetical protein